jgi:hypothetical protein
VLAVDTSLPNTNPKLSAGCLTAKRRSEVKQANINAENFGRLRLPRLQGHHPSEHVYLETLYQDSHSKSM